MLKTLTDKIFKTKLALRIWLYMVSSTLVVLLFIYILLVLYSNKTTVHLAIEKAKSETHDVASNFSDTYDNFLSRFILKAASSDFKQELKVILNNNKINYGEVNNGLQPLFTDLVQMNNLVSSALLEYVKGEERTLFYSYRYHFTADLEPLKKDPKFQAGTGISILSTALDNKLEVLPIAIPLSYNQVANVTLLANNFKEANFITYFFLDLQKVNTFLQLYCDDSSQGTLYLVDSKAHNLSLPTSSNDYTLTTDSAIKEKIQTAITNHTSYAVYKDNHIYVEPIHNTDLYLVNIIPHEHFTSEIHTKQSGMIVIGIISILLITSLSIFVSQFVTRPLNLLMEVVQCMKNNTYHQKLDLKTKDEISQLSDAIDSMYQTIQQQIVTIKQEEEQKYNAYLQMLSEQINPHFIYNALEFINIEVYTNHPENASKMISNLAKYLRISLSYGENELLITQELEQVMAYINIINDRFNHGVHITTSIPENLLNKKILKCTIQPLVENSLKHGFKIGVHTTFPITPIIEIKVFLEKEYLIITVADNGAGIDVDRATQIMLTKQAENENNKHFGLNNIYERFKSFYGDVTITFSSIPFFENKVTIKIPAKFFC